MSKKSKSSTGGADNKRKNISPGGSTPQAKKLLNFGSKKNLVFNEEEEVTDVPITNDALEALKAIQDKISEEGCKVITLVRTKLTRSMVE